MINNVISLNLIIQKPPILFILLLVEFHHLNLIGQIPTLLENDRQYPYNYIGRKTNEKTIILINVFAIFVVAVKEIKVNENMGLDDGSYIVLPHLTWYVKNKEKTTREMLSMYSENIAAKLAGESDVSKVTVFWEVPYHLEGDNSAKFSYIRQGDGMLIKKNGLLLC